LQQLTTIARRVDPEYPTNRAIIILTLVITAMAAAASLFMGQAPIESIISGLIAGLAVFLAWAIARELDPDSEYAAFLPALICICLLIFFPQPGVLTALFLLLLLRIINRTTGQPAGVLDSAALLLLAGWLVLGGFWVAGPAAIVAFILDRRLNDPNHRQGWFAVIAFLGMLGILLYGNVPRMIPPDSSAISWLFLLAPLLFLSVIQRSGRVRSPGDQTGEPLDTGRVQAARVLFLSVVMLAIATGGSGIMAILLVPWAGLVGLGMYGMYIRVQGTACH